MTVGLFVLICALLLGTTLGLLSVRKIGRFRIWTERAGTGRVGPRQAGTRQAAAPDTPEPPKVTGSAALAKPPGRLSAADLGVDLGEQATLVQFSSVFCAPCRATRLILRDISDKCPGVAYIDIDAESHLDLVRRLNVLRTPTVFVLNADGEILARASGKPARAEVLAVLEGARTPPVG